MLSCSYKSSDKTDLAVKQSTVSYDIGENKTRFKDGQ